MTPELWKTGKTLHREASATTLAAAADKTRILAAERRASGHALGSGKPSKDVFEVSSPDSPKSETDPESSWRGSPEPQDPSKAKGESP